MAYIIEIVKLLVSIVFLGYSADLLVKSSCRLARALGISAGVIGLTLIAYGTSVPEFAVSTISSASSHSKLSVSNIFGSNIFNLAIAGVVAFILGRVAVTDRHLAKRDNIVLIISTAIMALLFFFGGISRVFGALMVLAAVGYIVHVVNHHRNNRDLEIDGSISWKNELMKSIFFISIVVLFAKVLVDSAVNVAKIMGISEWVIGVTVIAFGTSIPEGSVAIAAAKRGEIGLSLGNLVGSNIFNTLWILGFAAFLNPLEIPFSEIRAGLATIILLTILFSAGLWRKEITRVAGVSYVLIYSLYIAHVVGLF